MKTIIYFFLVILLYGCSFNNSSDFWRNENEKKLSKANNDDNLIQSNILFNQYKKNVIEYSEKSNFFFIKK